MEAEDQLRAFREDVRAKLRDVEFCCAYAAAVARRVRSRHRAAKFLVALAGCVPFIAKLQSVQTGAAEWIVASVPLIAIALPIWNPDKLLEVASSLHGRYAQLLPAFRQLFRDARDIGGGVLQGASYEMIRSRLVELEKEAAVLQKDHVELPDIAKLKKLSWESIPSYRDDDLSPGGFRGVLYRR